MPKSNEVISLHIGQAGCSMGTSCWELSCLENDVELDGTFSDKTSVPLSLFMDVGGKKMSPRAVFVDLEPSIIDDIRVGKFRQLFRPNNLLNGNEDAGNCFGRGFSTLGIQFVEPVKESVRTLAERTDDLNYFLIQRASGGGTGSGLTACLMEELWLDYPKMNIYDFCISLSSGVPGPVEPYNAAFTLHHSLEYSTLNLLFDNYSCYNILDKFFDVCNVEFTNINQLLAQINSRVIESRNDGGSLTVNLIPFPRLQFPVVGFAPLISKFQTPYDKVNESLIVKSCFENSNQVSVSNKPVKVLPQGDFAPMSRSCVLLSNGTQIKQVLSHIIKKFDKPYSKRAFVHWYTAEDMEEGDFQDTRLDLDCLITDYSNIETET